MNVQFTTSPGVLNVMSNKRYMGPIQCSVMLSYYPPIPKVRTKEMLCISSLLSGLLFHYLSASSSTTFRGSYVWNIWAVYIYILKCGSLPGVIKFVINALHRLTCRQEIYHYKTGSMHFRRPPLNGNVYELKVRNLRRSKLAL